MQINLSCFRYYVIGFVVNVYVLLFQLPLLELPQADPGWKHVVYSGTFWNWLSVLGGGLLRVSQLQGMAISRFNSFGLETNAPN
jgi:hypothetical protein